MRRLAVSLFLLAAIPASAKPPIWDQRIDSPNRFKVLKPFNSEAVLDRETGVVWALRGSGTLAWESAFSTCANEDTGGRGGWRLPTVHEMRSLARLTGGGSLPDGHPFDLTANLYWTSTTVPSNTANAFIGDLDDSVATSFNHDKTDAVGVWCVRGGIGTDDDAL